MPPVQVSETVLWTDDPGNESDRFYCALVTAVYEDMIDVAVAVPGASNLSPHIGVRYILDPNKNAIANAGEGVWAFRKKSGPFKPSLELPPTEKTGDGGTLSADPTK